MTPRFSLIFVNYQSAGLLKRALASWEQHDRTTSFEFILVNNDRSEAEQIAQLAEQYGAKVVTPEQNFGFGEACNRGAAVARGQWLFFLNPDTEYLEGSLTVLEEAFAQTPRSLGGIRLVNREGKPEMWSGGLFPTFGRLLLARLPGYPRAPLWEQVNYTHTDWVSGAGLVIPKPLFLELGGFDCHYFLYFEDIDLAYRLKQSGGVVWRTPRLTVLHVGGGSQPGERRQKQAYYTSQRRYFARHRPRWEAYLLTQLHRLIYPCL